MRISDWSSDVCSSDLFHQLRDPIGRPMSSDLNLSQEELEALRQGIADGSIASNAGVMPDGEVAPYAFGSDEERSFGELHALHLLNERLARGMRQVFQPMLRVQPKVSADRKGTRRNSHH